ncbi:hypothetical protein ACFQLX_13115 [Streptomyces polyrhachis]|uniref:Small secreted protein n=1 Tax=Streptomyces polyrhachis TaxID=1282885 RepID=A0ABW2GEA2_9ACTN
MLLRKIAATAAVVCAALALTGCGSDDGPKQTPGLNWADGLCQQLDKSGDMVSFPEVDMKKPKEAQASMLVFLTAMDTQLGAVEKWMKKTGAPEVDGTKEGYDKAVANLAHTRSELGKARTKLKDAKVTTTGSLVKVLASLDKDMAALNDYAGPHEELKKNEALKPAFAEAPKCLLVEKETKGS